MTNGWRRVWAVSLFGVAFAITAFLGIASGQEHPPAAATSTLLVVLAGVFQFASASAFHQIGKADPTLARSVD